jgi:hypothetical protein
MRIGDLAGSVGEGLAALPEWGATEIAVDAFHHTVYALATGLGYRLLDAAFTQPSR